MGFEVSILYQPQYRVHGTSTWVNWGSPTANTSITIGANPPGPALSPLTQYDFQVVATNSVGSISLPAISATTPASGSVQTVALSPQTFTAGSAAGTLVGNVTVTLSSGTFNGTLTVTGTDASFFQSPITGGTLRLSGTATTARTYNINIVATQSGLSNSPFSQNFPNISATSPTGTLTAPTQASNAGFNTLVFTDDFTTNSINPGLNLPSGSKWCWGRTGVSTSNYTVNTTATAASVNNGNSGGGNNASSAGGIMTLTGISGNTGNIGLLSTAPGNTTTAVTGTFHHGYFECYMQFNAQGSSSSGWPGFWWWSVQNNGSAEGLEVDILEYSGAGDNVTPFTGGPYISATNFHEHGGTNASTSINLGIQDSNWHTFGVLWTGNGTTGTISSYKDNVLMGSVATGASTNFPSAESIQVYINFSAGLGWPINVDWVRIWQ